MSSQSMRHLGVNALFLEPRMGGIGTYVRRLLPAIAELRPDLRVSVFVNEQGRELLAAEPWSGAVELVHSRALGLRGLRAATELLALGAIADRRGVDVLHSVAMTGPLRGRAAHVAMVPDTIWLTHPDPGERYTVALWRAIVPPVARSAARVIAISEATRRELTTRLGLDPRRIDVIPLSGDEPAVAPTPEAELRNNLGLGDGPIVLAVSAAKAHKNVVRLIEALPAVATRHPAATLVIPGNPTGLAESARERAAALGVAESVVFPGWVDAADLEGLYAACACFAFPSLAEGFGLPVLEAMARGAAVACSNASSLPEVAGDAALLFDPLDPADIAAKIDLLLSDDELAGRLRTAGRARSAEFSWRRTAELTVDCYERAFAEVSARR